MSECCICTRPNEFSCPSCDEPFCFSCFVDHGKSCYAQMKQKAEQKKCSVCGRYASINPTVHCSDCQIEICRSCLWAHKKTHEKWTCVFCGHPDTPGKFALCGTCNKPVCSGCDEKHQRIHKSYCAYCRKLHYNDILNRCSDCHKLICVSCGPAHKQAHTKSYARCTGCGERTTTECDECKQPYCFPCFAKHRAVHEQASYTKYRCSGCNRIKTQDPNKSGSPFWQCPQCHEYYCEACTMRHTHVYARANFAGRFNPNDFDMRIDPDKMDEILKSMKEATERINAQAEEARKQARAEEERKRQEQKAKEEEARRAREKAEQEAFFKNFWNANRYDAYGNDEEEPDAYKAHYTGQQSQNHSQYSRQQTASAPSGELTAAFKLLQLSTRATVQEVKRAFKREAKKAHPDVGGTKEAFVKLNNAYELALSHAERNER